MVAEVAAKLAAAQAVIVAEYRGLDVGRVTQLRAKARKSGLYLRVLKNTLARRAVKGTPFEKLTDKLVGPLMYGIAADPVAGAKVLSDFARENEHFVIRGGAMPNTVMSDKDVKALREVTSPGLKEAKELVDGAPKAVKEGVSKADAAAVLKKLIDAGAKAEIK